MHSQHPHSQHPYVQRRVVVTGIGLICGVGKTSTEVWEGLLAGRSGMAEIKAFDLTGHSVRFAAEVKDFDPLVFIEKKEARKMGRFIHFAIAAADEAMKALRSCCDSRDF